MMGIQEQQADVVILGAGGGGYPAAFLLARAGLRVVMVDPIGNLGGNCLAEGCIPSKAVRADFRRDAGVYPAHLRLPDQPPGWCSDRGIGRRSTHCPAHAGSQSGFRSQCAHRGRLPAPDDCGRNQQGGPAVPGIKAARKFGHGQDEHQIEAQLEPDGRALTVARGAWRRIALEKVDDIVQFFPHTRRI